jgi:hypothetical protein
LWIKGRIVYQFEKSKSKESAEKDRKKQETSSQRIFQGYKDVNERYHNNWGNTIPQNRNDSIKIQIVVLIDQIHQNIDKERSKESESENVPKREFFVLKIMGLERQCLPESERLPK